MQRGFDKCQGDKPDCEVECTGEYNCCILKQIGRQLPWLLDDLNRVARTMSLKESMAAKQTKDSRFGCRPESGSAAACHLVADQRWCAARRQNWIGTEPRRTIS